MLVESGSLRATKARPMPTNPLASSCSAPQIMDALPPVARVNSGFSGSYADWCEEGFSICEGYLIEAQNLYLQGDLAGFRAMAEAQFDDELEDETLVHANALLVGLALYRQGDDVRVVETGRCPVRLNLINLANLFRAMETTKGDMRMPRLHPDFEKILRKALVLS